MSLSPTKRRAEQFAELLEHSDRTDDPTLAPLVALSTALQTAGPAAEPAPEFRTALRQRLGAGATVQGVGETTSLASRVRESAGAWRMQRRLAAVAGGAAAVTAIAGVGISASRSLPGDAFYGLKRADESVQLAFARGDEAKGKKHLEFARARLSEVKALAAQGAALPSLVPGQPLAAGAPQSGNSDLIAATLRAMDEQTRAGATDLFLAYQHSGSTEPLSTLNDFTVKQYAELMALLPSLPSDLQPPAKRSLALLRIVSTDTRSLAPRRSGAGTTDGKTGEPTRRPTTKRSGSASSTPKPTPSTVVSPTPTSSSGTKQSPTGVETIPPVPTVVPLPTDLPTTLPPLPDVGSLGSLLDGS